MQSQAQLRGEYSGTSSWQNTFTRSNNELPSVSQLLFLINPIQRWTWHTFPSHIYFSFFFSLLLTFWSIPEFMTSFDILLLPNALYPRVLWTWNPRFNVEDRLSLSICNGAWPSRSISEGKTCYYQKNTKI